VKTGSPDTEGSAPTNPNFSQWTLLSYLEQNGEWEDLVLYDLKKKTKRTLVQGADFMLSTPIGYRDCTAIVG
jgi:hypothetical protein